MDKVSTFGVLFLVCVAGVSGETRRWLPNINYNNPQNWAQGRVPCGADRVVLRQSQSLVLELPEGRTLMAGLVLPQDSQLLLPSGGEVVVTGDKASPSCPGQDAVFRPSEVMRWTDPAHWDGWGPATPDLERLPCPSETAHFPAGGTFRVLVPTPVTVGILEVNGVEMDSADWTRFANSEEGARQFFQPNGEPAAVTVNGEACEPSQWCDCDNEYLRPVVCAQPCSVPLCREPVQPTAFCCPFCGAYFLLNIESVNKSLLLEHIESFVRGEGVVWHASRVRGFVQVVLMEDGEYSGEVAAVAEGLRAALAIKNSDWVVERFHASGHVWYPTTFGQVVGHFFSLFVFAALALGAIIVFMSQDWSWVAMRVSSSMGNRPFVFARFENLSGEVTVASEETQNTVTNPQQQAFDNPMYGATRQEECNLTLSDAVYTELEESSRAQDTSDDILLDSTNFSEQL